MLRTALLLLLPALLPAREPPGPPPLPGAEALFAQARTNQRLLQSRVETYVWHERSSLRTLDGGRVVKEERHESDVTWVEGSLLRRKVSEGGQSLAPEAQAREDVRMRARAAALQGGGAGPVRSGRITALDVLECTRAGAVDREVLQGTPCLVVHFGPNGDLKARDAFQEQACRLEGAVYLEEASRQVVRLDARLAKPLRIGLGLVATFAVGSSFSFQQARLEGGIWMPVRFEAHFKGRVALFRTLEIEGTTEFRDYQRALALPVGAAPAG
jgi:hypothetical protein